MLKIKSEQILNSFLFFSFFCMIGLNDFRFVEYDSEPDYMANALSILQYGYPLNAHHPGTFSYYFLSAPVYLANFFEFNLSKTIYFLRILIIFLGSLIILNQKKLSHQILLLTLFFILISPGSMMVMSVISAEFFLLPLSIALIFFMQNYQKNIISISLLFGLLLNIKLTAILLMPFLILGIKSSFNRKSVYIFIKSFLIILVTYLILLIPVFESAHIPFLRIFSELVNIAKPLLLGLSVDITFYFITAFFVLFFALFIFLILNKLESLKLLLNKFTQQNYSIFLLLSFLFIISIYIFDNFFPSLKSISSASLDRHFLVAIPFISFHISKLKFMHYKILQKKIILPLVFGASFLLITHESFNRTKLNYIDQYINNSQTQIFLFPSAAFNSEYHFLEWLKYRYGKSAIEIPSNFLDKKNKDIEFLNVRNAQQNRKVTDQIFPTTKTNYAANFNKCIFEQLHHLINNKGFLIIENNNFETLENIIDTLNSAFQLQLIINLEEIYDSFIVASISDLSEKPDIQLLCINN